MGSPDAWNSEVPGEVVAGWLGAFCWPVTMYIWSCLCSGRGPWMLDCSYPDITAEAIAGTSGTVEICDVA